MADNSDILKAILQKGGQGAKGQEALRIAAAELQAAAKEQTKAVQEQTKSNKEQVKQQKDSNKETKSAAQEIRKAAKESAKSSQTSKDINKTFLSGLTKTIGGLTSGIAKSIGTGLKNISGLRGIGVRPMVAATIGAAGLGGLGVASAFGMGGKGDKPATTTSTPGALEKTLLQGIVSLGVKLDSINNTLTNSNELLADLVGSQTSAARARIEADREARQGRTTLAPTGGAEIAAPKEGGGLGGLIGSLLPSLGSLTKFITPLFSGLGTIFSGLLRFAKNIGGPIAILTAVIASLEQKDWSEMFGNLSKVFDDLAQGRFLDAIVRFVGSLGDMLITGVGRLTADLLEWAGFEGAAKAVNDFLDNFDFATMLVDATHAIMDFVVDAFVNIKEYAKNAFDWVVNKVSQYLDIYVGTFTAVFSSLFDSVQKIIDDVMKGDILNALLEYYTAIPNAIVKGVGTLASKILTFFGFEETGKDLQAFIDSFDLATTIRNFFNGVMNKVIEWIGPEKMAVIYDILNFNIGDYISEKFTSIKNTVLESWDAAKEKLDAILSFNIGDYISEKLNAVVDSIKEFFIGMVDGVKNWIRDKVNLLPEFMRPDIGFLNETASTTSSTGTTTTVGNVASSTAAEKALEIQSNAARQQVQSSQPVVIPVPMGGGGNSANPPAPRISSGAVSTAPEPSMFDRLLSSGMSLVY